MPNETPTETRVGLANAPAQLTRLLFGYDFFVSYTWRDGTPYAESLVHALNKSKFTCFRDATELQPGANLPGTIRRALRKSGILVLLVTPEASKSTWMQEEIRQFPSRRRIVVIDIAKGYDKFETAHGRDEFMAKRVGEILRKEDPEGLLDGPDHEILKAIRKLPSFLRVRRATVLATQIAFLALFALSAGLFYARQVAVVAQADATVQREQALQSARRSRADQFASESERLAETNPARAGLWAAEALRATDANLDGYAPLASTAAEQALRGTPSVSLAGRFGSDVVALAFSADESRVVAVDDTGTAQVFALEDGPPTLLSTFRVGETKAIALNADGTSLAVHTMDDRLTVVRIDGEAQPRELTRGVQAVACDAEGLRIAVVRSHDVSVLDFEGTQLGILLVRTEASPATDLHFDGQHIVVADTVGGLDVWSLGSVSTGGRSNTHFADPRFAHQLGSVAAVPIDLLALSRDGRVLVTASSHWVGSSRQADLAAHLWDLDEVDELGRDAEPVRLLHEQAINSLHILAESGHIITTSSDRKVRVWASNGTLHRVGQSLGPIQSGALHPEQTTLALAEAGRMKILSLEHPEREPVERVYDVSSLQWSKTGRWLAGIGDGMLVLWDTAELSLPAELGRSQPLATRFSEDGSSAVTLTEEALERWDLTNPLRPVRAWSVPLQLREKVQVKISPDGNWIVAQSETPGMSTLRYHDDARVVRELPTRTWTDEPLFSSDGRWLLSQSGAWKLYDLSTPTAEAVHLEVPEDLDASTAQFSTEGQWLIGRVTAGPSGPDRVVLWRLSETGAESPVIIEGNGGRYSNILTSPDEQWLAMSSSYLSGQQNTDIILQSLTPGPDAVRLKLEGHELRPDLLRFTPDGRFLVSATRGPERRATRTRVWNLSSARAGNVEVYILPQVTRSLRLLELSSSGLLLATIQSGEGLARIWALHEDDFVVEQRDSLRGPHVEHNDHWSLTFSPTDDSALLIAEDDPTPYLWRLSNEQTSTAYFPLPTNLSGEQSVEGVAYSDDGRRLHVLGSSKSYYGGQQDRGTTLRTLDLGPWLEEQRLSQSVTHIRIDEENADGLRLREGADTKVALFSARGVHVSPIRSPAQLTQQLQRAVGRNMTWQEWVLSSPGFAYHKTFKSLPVHPSVIDELSHQLTIPELASTETVEPVVLCAWVLELGDPVRCNSTAWRLAMSGEHELAPALVDCALQQDPTNANYIDTRGLVRAMQGDSQAAIGDFQTFIDSDLGSEEDDALRLQWIYQLARGESAFLLHHE